MNSFAPRRFGLLAFAAAALLLAVPSRAADVQGLQQRWNQMDRCTKMAREKYPEGNAAAQAKRDAFMQECQRTGRLPPRQGIAPPSGSAAAEPAQ
jgi:hypothetical protein